MREIVAESSDAAKSCHVWCCHVMFPSVIWSRNNARWQASYISQPSFFSSEFCVIFLSIGVVRRVSELLEHLSTIHHLTFSIVLHFRRYFCSKLTTRCHTTLIKSFRWESLFVQNTSLFTSNLRNYAIQSIRRMLPTANNSASCSLRTLTDTKLIFGKSREKIMPYEFEKLAVCA